MYAHTKEMAIDSKGRVNTFCCAVPGQWHVMGVQPDKMLACGGGARSDLWRQMMADVYGMNVSTVDSKEGPALGVAILAMVGAGLYENVEDACRNVIQVKDITTQNTEHSEQYAKVYEIYKGLYLHLKEDYNALAKV